jgi:hypothetical protein
MMSEITRICAHCGKSSPLDAQFCPHCGYDIQGGLPASRASQLPLAIGKAALPVLAGVAGLIMRAGWKLLKERLHHTVTQAITPTAQASQPPASQQASSPRRTRRTIHIRSSWAVGDARGVWRQGSSEQTIEIED